MKRLLKWAAGIVFALVVVVVVAVLSVWAYYESVVGATPGTLDVALKPGELGTNVNVFSGTGGYPWMCGHDTPAATVPFGMVRLGPDTASMLIDKTGLNRSGYFYGDNKIIGFSHTRLVGADALEGGLFGVFPTVAARLSKTRSRDRATPFSHRNETAFPGYYAVRLPRESVLAEMTASPHVGIHRYTFDGEDVPHILIDVTSALGSRKCENGSLRILPESNEVEGSTRLFGTFSRRYGGLDAYFVARFSRPFASYGSWTGDGFAPSTVEASGNEIGADLSFDLPSDNRSVEVRLAISYVSIENARENLDAEAANRSFHEIAAAARDEWEKRLGLIRVQGGSDTQRRIFYTCLYRSFLMPTLFNDVNGDYIGLDKAVHKADGFRYFTDLSLWDTFRTVHPLYNLIARDDQRDMIRSLIEMAKVGGSLPRWPSGAGYTGSMMGTPADIAVTEAYLKGIRDFYAEAAYQAMRRVAMEPRSEGARYDDREGIEQYVKSGYCPSEFAEESASLTLEYAYADHAIATLAQELGHTEDAELFAARARNYVNVWNPHSLFFEEKNARGEFPAERDPLALSYTDDGRRYTRGYTEGSGWQWRWYVPFDPQGLIGLFPSREYFVKELDTFFAETTPVMGRWKPASYYWHGNEPDIHAAYLFNEAGRPDLTQKWVRWILDRKYADDYVGLDGNDDGGTLSAWYVFSALGFYPIAGTTTYQLGAPLFSSAEVQMGDHALSITTDNHGSNDIYVSQASLNGVPLEQPSFTHEQIAQGATLHFSMSGTPSK